jgi:putative hemin transport protein
MNSTTMTLAEQWADLKKEQPKLRIRNAAEILGVSEAGLLVTKIGKGVTPLEMDIKSFLDKEVEGLGRVMALTRNDEVVHERKGEYLNGGFNKDSPVGLFVGEDIDLRIFLHHWTTAFAVVEPGQGNTPRKSFQFFDKFGNAVHKIYLIPQSNEEVFDALTRKYASDRKEFEFEQFEKTTDARNESPDVESFQKGWRNLKDTHDYFPLQRKHKLSRLQSLELAPEGDFAGGKYAVKVDKVSLRNALDLASEREVPIMVFVGNKGLIQIHTGPVKKVMEFGSWYNVMDPDFNLHINEEGITQAWVVRKPTTDGLVTSLELFNENEDLVCTFFGKRKPGIPEDQNWRALIEEVAEKQLIK